VWGAKEKLGQEEICIQKAQSKKGGENKEHKVSIRQIKPKQKN